MSAGHYGLLEKPRGAAMIETVSVLGFILALLFGSAQIALSGFYQLQLDAATFFYSHNTSLTAANAPVVTAPPGAFPAVPPAAVATSPSPAPATEQSDATGLAVLGEYTTGGTPDGSQNATDNRFGGASLIEPEAIQSKGVLELPSFDISIFSHNPITITAASIEGRSMVAAHDDDSAGVVYGNAQAPGTLTTPDFA